jgi:hypothetical protein
LTENPHTGRDWVALILAIGIATGLNCITFAVLYDAVFSNESGLSENATQILTGAFGGILGVLGSYVGYQAASRHNGLEQSIDQRGKPDIELTPEAPESLNSNPHIDEAT